MRAAVMSRRDFRLIDLERQAQEYHRTTTTEKHWDDLSDTEKEGFRAIIRGFAAR